MLMGQRLQSALTDPNSPNVVAPGKRPRITLTPTIVLKDGQPFMVLSTPGGDNQDQALLQVMLNIIEFGMNPQEAVEAPRFDTQHYVSSFDNHEFLAGVLNLEGRFSADVFGQLVARGHKVKPEGPWGTGSSPTVRKTSHFESFAFLAAASLFSIAAVFSVLVRITIPATNAVTTPTTTDRAAARRHSSRYNHRANAPAAMRIKSAIGAR